MVLRNSSLISVATVMLVAALFLRLNYHNQRSLASLVALGGYSPLDWTYQVLDSGWTEKNFANGVENYDNSLFMQIYPLSSKILGVSPEVTQRAVLFFEPLFVIVTAYLVCQITCRKITLTKFSLVAILFACSYARSPNLGGFYNPFYRGLFYNAADLLRIGAIVACLKDKYLLSGILLGLAFTTHPALGTMAGVFIAAIILPNLQSVLRKKAFSLGLLSFALISGFWFGTHLTSNQLGTDSIPTDLWFQLTRAFNYHWYPIDLGFFTFNSETHLIPTASFLLVLIYYLETRKPLNGTERKLTRGFIAVMFLVIIGVVNSYLRINPTLTKIALQRSSDLFILLGLPIIVGRYVSNLEQGNIYQKLLSTTFIFASFISPYPVLPALGLVLPHTLQTLRKKTLSLTTLSFFTFLGLLTFLKLSKFITIKGSESLGIGRGNQNLIILCFTVLIITWSLKKYLKALGSALTIFILITILGTKWIKEQSPISDYRALGNSYKEVQIWARDNTAETSLFMPDPTICYGWRDYSQRSSFGNLREWLHTSWLYNSNFKAYQEGLIRTREFGLDPTNYLNFDQAPKGGETMLNDLRKIFYDLSDTDLEIIAKKYEVNYIVKDLHYLKNQSHMPVVYQNEHFIVYKV